MKANMNDVCASIGLSQLRRYESDLLPHRKSIFDQYNSELEKYDWAYTRSLTAESKQSSAHLYLMRFHGVTEDQRDQLIDRLSTNKVGTSVHYLPMATFTYFKKIGYDIKDYPQTFKNYSQEITLPVYNSLKEEQVAYTIEQVIKAFNAL